MSNVVKLKRKAVELEQKKQFDRAVQAYIELLEALAHDIDDSDIPLYNRVGDLLMRQNGAAEALVYYEKAVDLYSERGFLNNAIALCNKILRQSPGRSIIYYKLGKISATKGFKSDAKRNFLEYADRMEKSGRRDEAFRALKEFAELCPDQDDVRLMLAEHLARDNRRDEAIEQLQTLHAKLEHEGRSAEAIATLDRMKAIDPNVQPRPSSSYQSQKSNELIFLDIEDVPLPRPASHQTTPPGFDSPASDTPTGVTRGSVHPALDGLTVAFVPDDAEAELLDGFTPTGENGIITPEDVSLISGLESGREDAVASDLDLPSLIDIPAIDDPEQATDDGLRFEVQSFTDDTLSESEFAALDLEPVDTGVTLERPHDLALPSALPLLESDDWGTESSEVAFATPIAEESPAIDIDAEIMAPISRDEPEKVAEAGDPVFDLSDEVADAFTHEELDLAASELDVALESASGAPEDEREVAEEREAADNAAESLEATDIPAAAEPDVAPEAPESNTPEIHSLEWEDLAAAAAQRDVEPMQLPPPPAISGDTPENEPAAEPEPNFFVQPTFGVSESDEASGLELSPLTPDTLAPDTTDSEHVAPITRSEPDDVSAPHEEASERRRTPARALEAQALVAVLRDQVQEEPNDPGLRRRLAEALLETGEREQGLRELDAAMSGFEAAGDLVSARDIASEILRLIPGSVRHHQKCVEYAVRSDDRVSLIEAYLQLADALFRVGEQHKARAVYGRVVELEPNEGRALAALELLSGRSLSATSDKPAPEPHSEPPTAPSPSSDGLSDLEAEITAAFQTPDDSGEQDAIADDAAAAAGIFTRPALIGGGDFVDLGALLRAEQPEKSTRMVLGDAKQTGDEQADFEDMLRRFKQGVAANVDDEDFDSHYDLGVAYKEMGLIDDAIAQFQKALRSDNHRTRAYEALGQCFLEIGQYQVAATLLTRAVETTRVDDRVLVGTLYLLAYACEQLQREREALMYYHRVFAVDVDFRDVASRIRALESHVAT